MKSLIVVAVCVVVLGCAAHNRRTESPIPTDTLAGLSQVTLASGENRIDLDGDGRKDIVMVGWRENNNAHGHKTYSFYRLDAASPTERWQVVPFADSAGFTDATGSTEGADCTLSDIRVLRTSSGRVTVMRAERDFGDSYADSALVTFKRFELTRNPESVAGFPDVYFKETSQSRSRGKYCDVGDAFAAEQGIPGRRGGR